jgi:predicted short-subunit dehydrogenase-like oxidoreductase (DUF2520 family)
LTASFHYIMDDINSISIVGSGNVGTQLAKAFYKVGINIDYIYSYHHENALILANKVQAKATNDLELVRSSDLVIICVPDDLVLKIANKLTNKHIAYTSGSVELPNNFTKSIGVFYPLQTFDKTNDLNMNEVPLFIEGNNDKVENILNKLGSKISSNVSKVNSQNRKKYHLSAVFVNNFTNHLIHLAHIESEKNNLNWKYLLPLLKETLNKNLLSNPFDNQTGPARRNDQFTIDKHLNMLDGYSKEIYKVITESIKSTYYD